MISRRMPYCTKKAVAFVQPVLTSNGTLGGDSFACSANSYIGSYYPYIVFTSGTDSLWHSGPGLPAWLEFYNPIALRVTKITVMNHDKTITAGSVQGCNDGNTWKTIVDWTNSNETAYASWDIDLSKNIGYYKYYRLYITATNFYYSDQSNYYAQIKRLYITAKVKP